MCRCQAARQPGSGKAKGLLVILCQSRAEFLRSNLQRTRVTRGKVSVRLQRLKPGLRDVLLPSERMLCTGAPATQRYRESCSTSVDEKTSVGND